MGISNEKVKEALDSLFGETRAAELREKIKGLSPEEREIEIIEGIVNALYEMGGKFSLPFRFKDEDGARTSHHLIFCSKHPLGYKIMKGIMANMSSEMEQGVPTFEYNSATQRQPRLFELNRPLQDLEKMLKLDFSGQTILCGDLIEGHHIGRRYIEKNYKEVLRLMENKGEIICDPPKEKRRRDTMSDKVKITFPS